VERQLKPQIYCDQALTVIHNALTIATQATNCLPVTAVPYQVAVITHCLYLAKSPDYFLTKVRTADRFCCVTDGGFGSSTELSTGFVDKREKITRFHHLRPGC
jgi:hypothetical protein